MLCLEGTNCAVAAGRTLLYFIPLISPDSLARNIIKDMKRILSLLRITCNIKCRIKYLIRMCNKAPESISIVTHHVRFRRGMRLESEKNDDKNSKH